MTKRKTLYLVDAANILFRAYYAIGPMSNSQGMSTGALFGFIRTILKLIDTLNPDYLACVFDGPNNKKQRQEIYEHYKSHRTKMPEDLYPQLEAAVKFCKLKGICVYMLEGVEADDTIGSIATWAQDENLDVFICSSDKDLCQLVNNHVKVVHLHKENLIIDSNKVEEIYGVKPSQIVDLLALMGDTSDNIPGIEGVGPKTASTWIKTYHSIDGIYDHIEEFPEKKKTLLIENKDNVLMSKKLAQIIKDVKFTQDIQEFTFDNEDTLGLKEMYQSMQFYSLLKNVTPEKTAEFNYSIIDSEENLKKVVQEQKKAKVHIIDVETTSLNPMDAKIVGLSLCDEKRHIYYIPFNDKLSEKLIVHHLKELEALSWTGHNIKYDFRVLQSLGFDIPLEYDTMIASYLVDPNQQKHGLDTLALEHFGIQKISYESLAGTGKHQKTLDQVPVDQVAKYCSEDAFITLRLKELFDKKLNDLDLNNVFYDIEIPLIPVLARMENKGIFVDTENLKELGKTFRHRTHDLEKIIFREAGQEFNISSPKQLSHILFDVLKIKPVKKTQTGYSTSADVLESLQDQVPFVRHILEYRTFEKLRTTYVESLLEQINPRTHRIHCTFNQSVAATGRLSSQDPNLQNIPIKTEEGRQIRAAFKPQHHGYSFVALDYSQIELRLLAHMSEDPILLEAFKHNQDIHARTASEVFGVALKDVTPQMRQKAKAVNFGILYGQQAFGLSQGLNLSFAEAKEFIEKYFDKYKKVKEFLESQKEFVRKHGYSTTLTGRKRPIPDIHAKNPMIRQAAERLAINTPLQGTAADLIKLAMIDIDKKIYKHDISLGDMLLQIHDELLFEVKNENIDSLSQLAKKSMENVFHLKVPLTVDISVGKNWGEC
jgi:DNA polymerase I